MSWPDVKLIPQTNKDTAEYTGENVFGKIATGYCDNKYNEMFTKGV